MSSTSAGVTLCEPTELYNIVTQCSIHPAVLTETYLSLFDARDLADYNEAHVILARSAKKNEDGQFRVPFGIHLFSCLYCVVYDSNTVSIVEDTPAVRLANLLASKGPKNPVKIVKGGYERFSAEYPFLRTQKIMYTPLEMQVLPLYPSEILPLSLYLGDHAHAHSPAINYDLKIRSHLSVGKGAYNAFPEAIPEFHVEVHDEKDQNLLHKFEEAYDFIEAQRKKSERVLVFSELGISRGATVVIAYLMKKQNWLLKEAFAHVQKCRNHVCPLKCFLQQLLQWEERLHGQKLTNIHELQ